MTRDAFMRALEAHTPQEPKGDVVFLLQGDGLYRAPHAMSLWQAGAAPVVAIVGSASDRAYGSYPSAEVRDELFRLGLPPSALIFEDTFGAHTRAEADRAMQLARERGWKRMLILTSPHHQYRAFLTHLKAMRDAGLDLVLINAPAPLSMTDETPWGRREDLVAQEFARIDAYQQKGDVASFADGIAYLESH
jgi:uncharacterized SAM-binding protein YcdF (DUF218 family)